MYAQLFWSWRLRECECANDLFAVAELLEGHVVYLSAQGPINFGVGLAEHIHRWSELYHQMRAFDTKNLGEVYLPRVSARAAQESI
jgi:hypothetical protein